MCLLVCSIVLAVAARQAVASEEQNSPRQLLAQVLAKWADLVDPRAGATSRTLTARIKLIKSDGLPQEVAGLTADLAFQAPDELRASGTASGLTVEFGQIGRAHV